MIPRRAVASWVLYDLANTIFSMGVVSLYFPTWVRATVGEGRADSVLSLTTAVSMGLIFIASPLLGAMTDRARRRMPFLIVSTVLCVALTLTLGRMAYWPTLIAFVLANAAYQAGLQFYDALLPEVSTPENRGRISGIGVGLGYLGSYFAVGIGMVYGSADTAFLFTAIGIAFLLLAIPCFVFVSERGNANPRPIFGLTMIRESTQQTWRTLRSGSEYPGLIRFLIGRMFYTDALNTLIMIMALFTINVSVAAGQTTAEGEKTSRLIMMSAISFAVVGGLLWGRLVDRIGPKRTLDAVLWLWIVTFIAASSVALFTLPAATLYVVASMAGIALGGTWSADRPLMLQLTPPERIGEFYGLYGMVGRFSAILGPVLWWAVTTFCTSVLMLTVVKAQGVAVLMLLGFVLIAQRILAPVAPAIR